MKKLPLILFTFLLLSVACSSVDCPVENVVATVYGLKKADGRPDTLNDTLSVIIRNIKGKDSALVDQIVSTTKFQLPIGNNNPEDTLLFLVEDKAGNSYRDTLYVKKENKPIFESIECKISYFHTITGVRLSSHNIIDSVSIVKSAVNYDLSSEHFYIYFRANR